MHLLFIPYLLLLRLLWLVFICVSFVLFVSSLFCSVCVFYDLFSLHLLLLFCYLYFFRSVYVFYGSNAISITRSSTLFISSIFCNLSAVYILFALSAFSIVYFVCVFRNLFCLSLLWLTPSASFITRLLSVPSLRLLWLIYFVYTLFPSFIARLLCICFVRIFCCLFTLFAAFVTCFIHFYIISLNQGYLRWVKS